MEYTTAQRPLDRRQRKSREAIQNALLVLLRDKTLDQITICELAAKADVNRKTFYNNYRNLQDVRNELDNRYLDAVFALFRGNDANILRSDPEEFFRQFFRALYENMEQSRLIFESGENICLSNRLKEIVLPYMQRVCIESGVSPELLTYQVEFLDNGLSALINTWLHSSPMLPPEDIAHLAARMTLATARALKE